ncbi:regulator component [Streptomyces sp. Ru87]|uniref:regulator component n=1 Tax=Streptomyces sp. Ru87 TaxID=2044307 RepID=UPI000BFA6874|nr:regulator component [Streptomyces sp. Ru87]PGH49702.1 regulator component [Streptomyces sp. Ru87]
MEHHRLRSACEERVRRLGLPHRFDTEQLCDAVAAQRGRPIVLRPLATAGAVDAPCGIRVETDSTDYLFYESATSSLHRTHILAHEIAHIVCDHPGSLSLDEHATLAEGINPALIRRMAGRTSYTTQDEREAELMATVIRQRMYQGRVLPPSEPAGAVERWEALFAEPQPRGTGRL